MKYTENMTFEEASKALIDELNANLATLHQNYHVEQSDFFFFKQKTAYEVKW